MENLKVDDRIELRPFAEADAAEILELVRGNYEHLRPFIQWATEDYSLETARNFIERSEKASAEKTGQTFGIFENEKIIGAVSFVAFNWTSRRTELGYWIDKSCAGRGIITKSCKVLVDHAFEKLEMNRIEIRCAAENVKSRAVPERLDFKLDGILRQSEWRHTRFYDMTIYSLLAEEWEKSKK